MPIPETQVPVRRLLRDVVHEKIADAILSGQLDPGERLLDEEISAWLGASRTPIREAIIRLERDGLVEVSSNKHTKVAQFTPIATRDAVDHLGLLHVGARMQAGRLCVEDRGAIVRQARASAEVQAQPWQVIQALWDLHVPLVRAAGNKVFSAAVREAHVRARLGVRANPDVVTSGECANLCAMLVSLASIED